VPPLREVALVEVEVAWALGCASKNFTHDHTNGRPWFLNVRAKLGKPNLRVVVP
jgi:hypothetical protein